MNESQIAVRYSKALFLNALEENIQDKVMDDLKYISETLRNKDMIFFMESPVVKSNLKEESFKEIFQDKIEELTLNFLILVLKNKRENYLNRIIYNYQKIYKAHKGLKRAEIIVSGKIEEDTKLKFHKILKDIFNSEIEVIEKIKPEIIGGFIIQVEDIQIDASLSTSLNKLKESLLYNTR